MEDILFDTALLDEIGSKRSTIKVLQFYLDDSPLYLQDLEALISQRDLSGIIEKSHKLKGSLGMLKADLLVSLLNHIEAAASSKFDFEKLDELLVQLKEKMQILDSQLLLEVQNINDSL